MGGLCCQPCAAMKRCFVIRVMSQTHFRVSTECRKALVAWVCAKVRVFGTDRMRRSTTALTGIEVTHEIGSDMCNSCEGGALSVLAKMRRKDWDRSRKALFCKALRDVHGAYGSAYGQRCLAAFAAGRALVASGLVACNAP